MVSQIDIDAPQTYRQCDPDGMLTHLHNFPGLCRQAWQMSLGFDLPDEYSRINKIIVLGMGGSAIGGDLIGSLAAGEAKAPILVCRDYILPQYVDAGTLIIASSYSGMTEETLSAFEQALGTPAKKLAITTGGKLKELCEKKQIPCFRYEYKAQPRAALPFSLFTLLGFFQKMGILTNKSADVAETLSNLNITASKIIESIPAARNPAKGLAEKLYGRLGVIYGAGITTEVAHRWKTQINENSKAIAFYEYFSELNHNSIVGYSHPQDIIRQAMVVILDSDLLHPRIRVRSEVTQKLLEQAGIYYQVMQGEGKSALSQMLSLILIGDYVSYYLAMLNQVDPTPVKPIDFLKESLGKI